MLPALARRWRGLQMNALDLLDLGGTRSRAMASIARTLRFIIQIVTLGAGTLAGDGAGNHARRDDRSEHYCRPSADALRS